MNNYEKIIKHLKTVKTSNTSSITSSLGVDRKYLSILVEKGLIDHPSRGIYSLKNTIEDEYFSLSTRCKRCIFSHDTALFFHDLTDRTPLNFSITIPSGYRYREHMTYSDDRSLYRVVSLQYKIDPS